MTLKEIWAKHVELKDRLWDEIIPKWYRLYQEDAHSKETFQIFVEGQKVEQDSKYYHDLYWQLKKEIGIDENRIVNTTWVVEHCRNLRCTSRMSKATLFAKYTGEEAHCKNCGSVLVSDEQREREKELMKFGISPSWTKPKE